MKTNYYVTDKTITFNANKENLERLLQSINFIKVDNKNIDISKVKSEIKNLSTDSHNIKGTTFIYRKVFDKVTAKKHTIYDKIREWAKVKGILNNGDVKTQYIKLTEEVGELAQAILKNNKKEQIDAVGDIIVVLTSLAELGGFKVEDAIQEAYKEIKDRTGKMVNGTFVKNG
tara:strand:+ start:89 stop:607 length:519 start_codon:yes stop_codon:yes gene_type:complete